MRKRLLPVAFVAMAGLLVGCSGSADPSANPSGGTTEPPSDGLPWDDAAQEYIIEDDILTGKVKLRVWIEGEGLATELMSAFNERYPDVQFEWEDIAKVDTMHQMALAGEAGNGADVFVSVIDQLTRGIQDGTAAPIGRYQEAITERVPEAFSSVVSADGTMYGIPLTTESIALFYNKTLLEQLTGSADPATTWEEITELAATYNNPSTNQWTVRFNPSEIYHSYAVLSSAGWHVFPDGDVSEPGFDDPALVDALAYYNSLRQVWNVPSADATWDTIEGEFANGQTPYVITGPWSFSLFDEGSANNGFEYGVTVLPKKADGEVARSLAGLQIGVVSGYSKYPGASRVFANFLASDEGAAILYETTGQIPAVKQELLAGIEGVADNPYIAGIVAQSANAELLPQVPGHFWDVGNELVANIWNGLLGPEAAAEKAAAGYRDLSDL